MSRMLRVLSLNILFLTRVSKTKCNGTDNVESINFVGQRRHRDTQLDICNSSVN